MIQFINHNFFKVFYNLFLYISVIHKHWKISCSLFYKTIKINEDCKYNIGL